MVVVGVSVIATAGGSAAFLPTLGAAIIGTPQAATAATAVGVAAVEAAAGVGAALAPAAAAGAIGGATTAAVVGGEVLLTAVGGAAGAAAQAAAAGAVAPGALSGATAALAAVGPFGWAILGADGHSWDCWKPVVLDESRKPSRGITLHDLCNHSNLRGIIVDGDGFVTENIRAQMFRLSPVDVDGVLAFHATPM